MDGTNLFQIFVAFLFLYSFPTCLSITSPNITTDQSALLALKSSITLPPDHILATNWTTTTPSSVCDWVGITCGRLHRRVIALRLPDMGLIGTIPPDLGNLSFLRWLNISNNSFYGDLPKELANIRQLRFINIRFNNFTGKIPQWFGAFSKLEVLSVSNNKFLGSIPQDFGNLQSLIILSMQFNQFSGSIPHTIFNMSSLEILAFTGNSLSGNLPADMCNCLPNLRGLFLSDNEFEGQIPPGLHECSLLQSLSLSANQFNGRIPSEIGNLTMLNSLFLGHNSLEGPLPIPPPSIMIVYLSDNSLSGEIPSLICNASSLEILNLSHNKLSGALPGCLGNFSSVLWVLDLRSNGFKGTLPLLFAKPNNLKNLDLNENQFEGPLPRSLTNCTSLEVLNVGNNKINDTFPYWLGTLPDLQVLVIRSNQFHGPINTLMSKFSFPKLRIVDLSYNGFTGYLPTLYFEYFQAMKTITMPDKQYMGDENNYYQDSLVVTMKGIEIELVRILTIFTAIDFSSNNFNGEIPNVVGKLNSLIVLNFSHNSLTGHIPESLGDLTNLESLDISSNRLTGKIPSQLTSLTFLAVLNLSWNRLHGPIPHGRQFNTFESGSYAGNPGLCGFPLLKECEENQTKIKPPVLQKQEDDPYFDAYFWKIVVIGYGCGMTLGLFLGSLMFLIGRPKFFVRLAEKEVPKKVVRLRRMVTDTVGRRK